MKRTKLYNLSALPFNEAKSASHEMLVLHDRLFPPEEGIKLYGPAWKMREMGEGGKGKRPGVLNLKCNSHEYQTH